MAKRTIAVARVATIGTRLPDAGQLSSLGWIERARLATHERSVQAHPHIDRHADYNQK